MHIPDGYISPATAVAFYGAAVPVWWQASQKMKRLMSGQTVPLLALFSAFCFTIMMFNVPVPGGTTTHAMGVILAAIVMGPWAATIAGSVALIIQALFFGDGGITAIGANCLLLAVVPSFLGYWIFRGVSRGAAVAERRQLIAAGIAAYIAINVAAVLVGVVLGIQPIFWSEGGRALYSPYGLETAIPAMLIPHLTIAGAAEVIVTVFGLAYVQRVQPALLGLGTAHRQAPAARVLRLRATVIAVLALVLLAPLGLIAAGTPWGEWSSQEVAERVGYTPSGLEELESTWSAPFPDYTLPWINAEGSFAEQALAYVLSAVIGIGLIFVVAFSLRILTRRPDAPPPAASGV